VLVTEDLIALIERSEAGRLKNSARASGGDVLEIAGGVAAFCGDGSPSTQVAAVGVRHDVTDRDLDAISAFYEGRAKQYEFKLSTLTDVPLRDKIVQRAHSLPEFETILVCDLTTFIPKQIEVDIRPIDASDTLEYAKRSVHRFHSGGEVPPGLVDLIAKSCLSGGALGYEVWMDGKPVAGCGLGIGEDIAWLQGAATEPEYRNRGLHKAMQNFRMLVAKEHGCTAIAQGALPGSQSQVNAQKSGMQVAFTRPTFYLSP
jgi:GNAT superfamily N-acetyltransferase